MITKIINISVLQLLYQIVIRSFRAKIKKQRKKKTKERHDMGRNKEEWGLPQVGELCEKRATNYAFVSL